MTHLLEDVVQKRIVRVVVHLDKDRVGYRERRGGGAELERGSRAGASLRTEALYHALCVRISTVCATPSESDPNMVVGNTEH